MKRYTVYVLIALAGLASVSCKDFLEKGPVLSQSTELTLSSYSGLNKATAGAYSYLGSDSWYGGTYVLESEMRSGNGIKHADHNSNRYMTEMNWNYLPDATSNMWSYGYVTVYRCNNVIENLKGKETPDVSEQDLKNLETSLKI